MLSQPSRAGVEVAAEPSRSGSSIFMQVCGPVIRRDGPSAGPSCGILSGSGGPYKGRYRPSTPTDDGSDDVCGAGTGRAAGQTGTVPARSTFLRPQRQPTTGWTTEVLARSVGPTCMPWMRWFDAARGVLESPEVPRLNEPSLEGRRPARSKLRLPVSTRLPSLSRRRTGIAHPGNGAV